MVSKPLYDQMAPQLCQFYVPGQPSKKTVRKKRSRNYLETIRVCQKSRYVKNPGMSKIRVCQKSGYVKHPGMSSSILVTVYPETIQQYSGDLFSLSGTRTWMQNQKLPPRSHAHANTGSPSYRNLRQLAHGTGQWRTAGR